MSNFVPTSISNLSETEIHLTKSEREFLFSEAEKLKNSGFLDDSALQYYKCLRNLTYNDVFPSLPKCMKSLAFYFFEKQNYPIAIQLINALKYYYKTALNEAELIYEKISEVSKLNLEKEFTKMNHDINTSLELQSENRLETDNVIRKENSELDFDFRYLTSIFEFKLEDGQFSNVQNSSSHVQNNVDACMLSKDLTGIGDTEYGPTTMHQRSTYVEDTRDSIIEYSEPVNMENQGDNPVQESNSEENSTRHVLNRLTAIASYMLVVIIGITIIIYAVEISFFFFESTENLRTTLHPKQPVLTNWKIMQYLKNEYSDYYKYFYNLKQVKEGKKNSDRVKNYFN